MNIYKLMIIDWGITDMGSLCHYHFKVTNRYFYINSVLYFYRCTKMSEKDSLFSFVLFSYEGFE